jgi:pantetheine-phosphate adenylyltransferase
MNRPRVGVYPGTFDPVTNGHMDIISRATRVVDHLIIAVATNVGKGPLFTLDERVALLAGDVANIKEDNGAKIEIRPFDKLLVAFAAECGATLIIRGLRAVSDFEYEFQMAGMNSRLNATIETVFLTASETNQFIASGLVKEIAFLGGDVAPFVSRKVRSRLAEKVASRARKSE